MIAFIIWSIVAFLFVIVGISSWKSEVEIGFFTGVTPPKMKDVKAYNRAVAKLWWFFSIVFEAIGIPLIFIKQNSPIALIIAVLVPILIIGIVIAYHRIALKYQA